MYFAAGRWGSSMDVVTACAKVQMANSAACKSSG